MSSDDDCDCDDGMPEDMDFDDDCDDMSEEETDTVVETPPVVEPCPEPEPPPVKEPCPPVVKDPCPPRNDPCDAIFSRKDPCDEVLKREEAAPVIKEPEPCVETPPPPPEPCNDPPPPPDPCANAPLAPDPPQEDAPSSCPCEDASSDNSSTCDSPPKEQCEEEQAEQCPNAPSFCGLEEGNDGDCCEEECTPSVAARIIQKLLSPRNDCGLGERELLKRPLRSIKCGCPGPCPVNPISPQDQDCTMCSGGTSSVWTPPPPPPCARCGASVRGQTESCYFCQITKCMRSGCDGMVDRDEADIAKFQMSMLLPGSNDKFCGAPEYKEDGSMKYKGGMCLDLTNKYLEVAHKTTPPGGFFDQFTGELGEDIKLQAITGTTNKADAEKALQEMEEKGPYKGGLSTSACSCYLWGKGIPEEEKPAEPEKRVCKSKAKPSNPDKCPPL